VVLRGVGLGAFNTLIGYPQNCYPHNILLEITAETGMVGLAIFLAVAGLFFSAIRPTGSYVVRLSCYIFLAGFINAFFTGEISSHRDLWASFGFLAAVGTTLPAGSYRTARKGGGGVKTGGLVSIIIPCKNEKSYIAVCLDSLLAQTWPSKRMEIIVADGLSDDGTRKILDEYRRERGVRVLDNPRRTTPCGLNLCIRKAKGDIIVRADSHAWFPPDYVEKSVAVLKATSAWNAGGYIITKGKGYLGSAIALALGCVFGVGGSRFRLGNYEGDADTVPFGAFPAWVFKRIGGFNEKLDRNQDNEFNWRIKNAGGRVYLSRDIHSEYYTQNSLPGLFRYFYRNSVWNVVSLKKTGQNFLRFRHFAPGLAILLGALTFLFSPLLGLVFLGAYLVMAFGFSLDLAMRNGVRFLGILPLVFIIIHFSYGIGVYGGLLRLLFDNKLKAK
jgi:glycosyltransferase involved in cell wall biosynthesis